jgi:hypothetical protein
MADASTFSTTSMFRANKRRKVYRKRVGDDDEEGASNTATQSPSPVPEGQRASSFPRDTEDTETSLAAILKRRKLAKGRKAGIEFTNSEQRGLQPSQSNSLVPVEPEMTASELAASRFTKQTGQVAEAHDKHM